MSTPLILLNIIYQALIIIILLLLPKQRTRTSMFTFQNLKETTRFRKQQREKESPTQRNINKYLSSKSLFFMHCDMKYPSFSPLDLKGVPSLKSSRHKCTFRRNSRNQEMILMTNHNEHVLTIRIILRKSKAEIHQP